LQLQLNVKDAGGHDFSEEVYWTINGIPPQ